MAKKDFSTSLQNSTDKKAESNLKLEIKRLNDVIAKLKLHQNSEINSLKIDQIKLSKNVRDDEFDYKYEDIENLAADIKKRGQLQPVLISQDGYLLTGYRRYHAILFLSEQDPEGLNEIIAYTYPKVFPEITTDELIDIQISENNQRREIDNFQLSFLYNRMLNEGHQQYMLADRFKKSRSLISMIVGIRNIDSKLVKYLKQFQIYGWSEQKFNALIKSGNDDKTGDFSVKADKEFRQFEKINGVIGVTPLIKIAIHENLFAQTIEFLKIYHSRLTDAELESELFKEAYKHVVKVKRETGYQSAVRSLKALDKILLSLKLPENSKEMKEAQKYMEGLKDIFRNNSRLLKKPLKN